MVYHSFAHYSREAAHWAIDNTFPSSAGIATITGGVAWYAYQVGMTYSQAPLTSMIVRQIGSPGYVTAPLVVPWLAPIMSSYFSIGASCCTSLTLNLIAKNFFNIDPYQEKTTIQTKNTSLDKEAHPLRVVQQEAHPFPAVQQEANPLPAIQKLEGEQAQMTTPVTNGTEG